MSKQAHKCGWCITGHHDSCQPSLTYFERTWHCECPCEKQVSGTDNPVSFDPPRVKQPTKETK